MKILETSAFYGIDRSNEEAYKNDPWYDVLGLGELGWGNLGYALWRAWYNKQLGGDADILPTDVQWAEHVRAAFDVRNGTRITKNGKGFRVALPIFHGSMNVLPQFKRSYDWYSIDAKAMAIKLEGLMPGVTSPESSVDAFIDQKISNLGLSSADMGFEDEDALDRISSAMVNLRIVSAPCTKALGDQIPASVIDAWGQQTADANQARTFVTALLRVRLVTLFATFDVSEASAKFICQGEPKMGLLGEYFTRALESEHLFGAGKWIHNVVPISKIAKNNAAEQRYEPVPRTDGNGLSVDAKGQLVWLPTVDNSEFVEEEMEQGGIQPNGEWTRMDTINPEANDYIMAPSVTGRMVRQRRPKGRNRLIYTDWHSARLSYTDDNGSVTLMDLSMHRPATVGQMANLLRKNIKELSGLNFAVTRGVEMGVQVPERPELYEPFCDARTAAILTNLLNTGKLQEYVERTSELGRQVSRLGVGSRQWTPEELNAFDPIWNDHWYEVDLIHANSPVPFMRHLAEMLRLCYEKAMDNQDQIFGRYVVGTTLHEMASLLVVVKYAGEGQQLKQLDLERRAKYVSPDLAPADLIEVKDIPFVSGKVSLFPHQVKAWNYIKNSPETMVLDVAAGGGKTTLALLDIAYQLGKGMKFPLVVCPEDLIKNYINDALWLFDGKMNMVVINGTTFNSPEWGEEKLEELVRNSPPNTIFLSDYNFIIPRAKSNRVQEVMYGTDIIQISLNTEFLKRIPWGGIWMDESHLTKNAYGSTNRELMRLTSTIPFKRQLSGTYISDNLTDVVGEFGLMDPQTFGDMESFEERFFVEGTRRSAPVPGAQRQIREAMSQNSNVVTIRRKEWAALLPRRSDMFWPVEMSDKQREVYNKILDIQREELEEQLAEDRNFADQLEGVDAEGGENDADILDTKLSFYLQRLERFITAPGSDPYVIETGALTGDDLLSPKLAKVVDILRRHRASGMPGKVLIWTQYVESAASMYRSLPKDLAAQSVLYTAADADTAIAEFKANPNKLFLFGCEKSMNTGHNFQFCSRIVRLETVWNWGTLEQGEARINRPTKDDPRREENGGSGIHYDWVFCNKSMDVTKNSRMISKLISTVKFYEQNNLAYQKLPDLDPIRLSKENIFAVNDWEDDEVGCKAYFDLYAQYSQLEQKEFDDFLADPANRIEPYTLEEGEVLPGSGLLKKIPYIPQMQLFSSDKLGLVPFVEYVSSTYSKRKKNLLLVDDEEWSPAGMKVHTEYGDCLCKGYNLGRKNGDGKRSRPRTMRVLTPDGSTVSVQLTMVWVITKETANGDDVRRAIGRKVGVDVSTEVVPTKVKPVKQKPVVQDDEDEASDGRAPADNNAPGFAVFLETYNHMLSLVVNTDDVDAANALPDLLKLGFVQVPNYTYSKVANWKILQNWLTKVQEKVEVHPQYLSQLEADIAAWKTGKTMEKFAHGMAQGQRKNFLLTQKTPLPKGIIKPYLVAHNGKVFLCLNDKVNQATMPRVRTATSTGITWKKVEGEHWYFAPSKQKAQDVVKTLFKSYDIINRKELVTQFADVRVVKLNGGK